MIDKKTSPNHELFRLIIGFANVNILNALIEKNVIKHLRSKGRTLEYLSKKCKITNYRSHYKE